MLNICLCIDLILTMKNPFYPAANRANKYYLVSAIVPIFIFSLIGIAEVNSGNKCTKCLTNSSQVTD